MKVVVNNKNDNSITQISISPGVALIGNIGHTYNKTRNASKWYMISTKNLVHKFLGGGRVLLEQLGKGLER